MANFNYRKFYEEKTGEFIPPNFDVHHIDLDRDNNSVLNLVALPKELHKKYHALLSKIQHFEGGGDGNSFEYFATNGRLYTPKLRLSNFYEDYLNLQYEMLGILRQMEYYISLRNFELSKNKEFHDIFNDFPFSYQ